jgi:hypothetical protein
MLIPNVILSNKKINCKFKSSLRALMTEMPFETSSSGQMMSVIRLTEGCEINGGLRRSHSKIFLLDGHEHIGVVGKNLFYLLKKFLIQIPPIL